VGEAVLAQYVNAICRAALLPLRRQASNGQTLHRSFTPEDSDGQWTPPSLP